MLTGSHLSRPQGHGLVANGHSPPTVKGFPTCMARASARHPGNTGSSTERDPDVQLGATMLTRVVLLYSSSLLHPGVCAVDPSEIEALASAGRSSSERV